MPRIRQGKPVKFMGVYGILCEPERKWYVGASVDMVRRIKVHLYEAAISPNHSHLHNDLKKHGKESFSTHILEYVDEKQELPARERFWQRATRSVTDGYNQENAGHHWTWKSQEQKQQE